MIFNSLAKVELVEFDERHFCLVIDDALLEPDILFQFAVERFDKFNAIDFSYYPGNFLAAPAEVAAQLGEFFQFNARRRFDARRCLATDCRFSIATALPEALVPLQWLCHRDDVGLNSNLSMQASVLYLFRDPLLGGTGFYVPTQSAVATGQLFVEARLSAPADFATKYGISAGYMHAGNEWFRRIGGIAAKWNRLIIYDGSMLHASDIARPSLLSPDPRVGRLTLNGFFTSRRHLA